MAHESPEDIKTWLRVHGLRLQVIGQSGLHEVDLGDGRHAALLYFNVSPAVIAGIPPPENQEAFVPLSLLLSQAVLEHLAHLLQEQGIRPVDHSAQTAKQLS